MAPGAGQEIAPREEGTERLEVGRDDRLAPAPGLDDDLRALIDLGLVTPTTDLGLAFPQVALQASNGRIVLTSGSFVSLTKFCPARRAASA